MIKLEQVEYGFSDNFWGLLGAMTSNSTNMDKSSYNIPYTNDELLSYKTTDFKLNIIENVFLKKYLGRLRSYRESREVSGARAMLLDKNPWFVSMEEYGTPELWYLILALNNCVGFEDFTDMKTYYVVDIDRITECLEEEQAYITKKTV